MNNPKILKISLSFMLLLFSSNAFSFSTGITGNSGVPGGGFCTNCHKGGIAPTVVITGSNSVTPGSTNSYTLTITNGQKVAGGFNVSASAGTLLIPTGATGIKTASGELTHTTPASAATDATGTIAWNFDWQAPATEGNYTLYGAGVSADLLKADQGDNAGKHSLAINVAAPFGSVPIVVISSPLTAKTGVTVLFDGSKSTPSNTANITQYEWKVDTTGAYSIDTNILSHSFTTAGRHTVFLKVTDSSGASATTFADIIIGNATIPVVNHTGPYNGETGTAINFDASASTSDSSTSLTNYIWDFGDGTVVDSQSATATIAHTYATAKTYFMTIAAQDGNGMTGVSATSVVVSTAQQPQTGAQIYATNCEGCHGAGGTGSATIPRSIVGATQTIILNAISTVTQMNSITLSNAEVQLVADFLAASGSTGDALYLGKCQICHGVAGVGGSAPVVIGATREMILDKISTVATMNAIELSSSDSQLIADYLGSASVTTGADYYVNKCVICHGAAGVGKTGVAGAIKGATQSMINNAIATKVPLMSGITLPNNSAQLVADYLGLGGSTGQEFYNNKCAICHGAAGVGITGVAPLVKGATLSMIQSAINNISVMTGINLPTNDAQLVADYLGSGGTTGLDFYTNKCSICHGAAGVGGTAPFVKGATKFMIEGEVNRVNDMQGINLTNQQSQLIANYLGNGGSTGQDYYTNKCLICHGQNGTGGSGNYSGPDIQNDSTMKYFSAIRLKKEMNGILLNNTEAQDIQGYLNGGGGGMGGM